MRKIITALSFLFTCFLGFAQQKSVRVLVLAENGGHHIAYTKAARPWLDSIAAKENFVIEYRSNTDGIDSAFLSGIQLFVQLDYLLTVGKNLLPKRLKDISAKDGEAGSVFTMQLYWVSLMDSVCGIGFLHLWAILNS